MKRVMKYSLLVTMGLAVVGCSKEPSRSSGSDEREKGQKSPKVQEHKKVQLWKDGPYWAETNIGAEKPWEFGYYFWWGDTVGYKWENGKWVASDGSSSGFSFDKKNTPTSGKDNSALRREGWITEGEFLAPEHDAAHVQWGGGWRMPTDQEMDDLCQKCEWTWTTLRGVEGSIVRGRGDYASSYIFLPAAGSGGGTSLKYIGVNGIYWSSVPYPATSLFSESESWTLYSFGTDDTTYYKYRSGRFSRGSGYPVRPVQGFTK